MSPGEYYLTATDSAEPDPIAVTNEASWIRDFLGSEYVPAYFPGVSQLAQAQVIAVQAGDEVQADFSLRRAKTAKISGLVIGKEGPASGTWIRLSDAEGYNSGSERGTTTDEKGRFEIKGVPPGNYLIYALQRTRGNGIYESGGQQRIEVNGENIDSVIISVGAGTTFQGRVTVEGASFPNLDRIGVVLTKVDNDEQVGTGGHVNKDGTFEIKLVSDGTYGVTLWGFESNWYIKSVRLGGDDVLEKGLQVEKGGPAGRIEVVVSSEIAKLDGSVSDDGTPVAGAHVRVVPEPETPYNRFRAQSLNNRPDRPFLIYWSGPGQVSCTCETWISRGR